jgi:RNA-directed DNA polymerase
MLMPHYEREDCTKSLGGKDDYKNLQILHRHCHDEKTTVDGSVVKYA